MTDRYEKILKTLARYEPDTVYIGTGEYVAECVRADDGGGRKARPPPATH